MNETNIRVCLIVFHFHLFVVGLCWMQEANSFGFKKCIVERQCIFLYAYVKTSRSLSISLFGLSPIPLFIGGIALRFQKQCF